MDHLEDLGTPHRLLGDCQIASGFLRRNRAEVKTLVTALSSTVMLQFYGMLHNETECYTFSTVFPQDLNQF
jgi:hypothetical protein